MRTGHVTHVDALYFPSAGHPRLRFAPTAGPRPDASQMSPASEGTPSSPLATSVIGRRSSSSVVRRVAHLEVPETLGDSLSVFCLRGTL